MAAELFNDGAYTLPRYDFVVPAELSGQHRRHPVVIVGGGVSGLTLACDLAQRGIDAVLLDEDDTVGVRGASSRGICYAQKTLEIFDRLGSWPRIREKGITWSVGKTLVDDEVVYGFNLATGSVSCQPPFVNLQQFYIEWFLVDRILELGHVELRWKSRVVSARQEPDRVVLGVETPAGPYEIEAAFVVDASGSVSALRRLFDLPFQAERGEDLWCISDVRFKKDLPVERWTWVSAAFNEGRGVWQHLMADGVWRIDYQMAPGSDPAEVVRPEVVEKRLRAHLGADTEFEIVWVGPYAYRTQLLDRFRHGRVLFIGDAAHVKSPFGARGGNSGIQDADNLGWKLAMVLAGVAPDTLLDSYHEERRAAAQLNIAVTQRSARFLAPRSAAEHRLRRAVLGLARDYEFARPLVNTGRMCVPHVYGDSAWVTNGGESIQNLMLQIGGGRQARLVELLLEAGNRFVALSLADPSGLPSPAAALAAEGLPLVVHELEAGDFEAGRAPQRLGLLPGTVLLLRPDQHVAARLPLAMPQQLQQALALALGLKR